MNNCHASVRALFAALTVPCAVVSAQPLLTLGEVGELRFNGGVSLRYDDNIYLVPDARIPVLLQTLNAPAQPAVQVFKPEDDLILTFSPGIELLLGKPETTSATLIYREDILLYSQNTENNTAMSNVTLKAGTRTARSSLTLNGSYRQVIQNDRDTGIIILPNQQVSALRNFDRFIRRDITSLGLSGETQTTAKTSVGGGITWTDTNFRVSSATGPFNDYTDWVIPVNFYYRFRPKLDLSAGFQYSKQVGARPNTGGTSYFYNVGARGEITPKLLTEFRVGLETRDPKAGDDSSTLAFDGTFTWLATAKSTAYLSFGRRFGLGALGDEVTTTRGSLRGITAFTEQLQGGATLSYEKADYDSANRREDDFYSAGVDLSYQLNPYVNLSAGYEFRRNDSTIQSVDFNNNVISLSASVRY